MKRIISHITILLTVLLVASCNWLENPQPLPKGEFKLTLLTTGLDTKGPETGAAGETNLNENLIDTVDIFFYQNGADNNTNAVHCLKMALPAGSTPLLRSISLLPLLRLPRSSVRHLLFLWQLLHEST